MTSINLTEYFKKLRPEDQEFACWCVNNYEFPRFSGSLSNEEIKQLESRIYELAEEYRKQIDMSYEPKEFNNGVWIGYGFMWAVAVYQQQNQGHVH